MGRKHSWMFVRGHYLFFSESYATLSENCELWVTDNVQGNISKHISKSKGGHWVYYLSNVFHKTRGFIIGEYHSDISPCFSRRISSHMTRFIQSRTSENIWWILIISQSLWKRDKLWPTQSSIKSVNDVKSVFYCNHIINELWFLQGISSEIQSSSSFPQACTITWLQD